MNSSFSGNNYSQKSSSTSSSSLKNYNFDFGIGSSLSSSSRPLKDQKNPSPASSAPSSRPPYQNFSAAWTPNKPSWTHQPSPAATVSTARSGLSNSFPMVGDIFGKSWNSSTPSSGIGVPKSDPSLFGDLLGSALGQGKGSTNVPLKSALPQKNAFSTGSLSDSMPKTAATTTNPVRPGGYGSVGNHMGGVKIGTTLGGPSMKSSAAPPASNQNKDPFGSLMDFRPKPSANPPPSLNSNPRVTTSGSSFGGDDSFGVFQKANVSKSDTFGIPPAQEFPKPKAPSQPNSGVDHLDMFFSSSAATAPAVKDEGSGGQTFMEANDWDLGTEFGGDEGGGATTELEGLPPPPAGVTTSVAKSKGLDNYKQGQFADAIKWLSWASVLSEKSGDESIITEILTCRASCYKEVGEYKKAVADCSKILELDNKNVAVLVQRALLYESTEKYKLGAEDLRAVLKIDPTNRLARTTIHRLLQLAG